MAEPFIGEVILFGGNFAPRGWAFCDGQILPINQNQSLFSLLGTTYGGDGRTSFALPDLRGRVPIHVGNGHSQGQRGGEEGHALSAAELPQTRHGHGARASLASAGSVDPSEHFLADTQADLYGQPGALVEMSHETVGVGGGASAAHENMQPYLALNFVIALQGLFPSRN